MPLIVSSSFVYSDTSSLQMVQLAAKLQFTWSISGHENKLYNLALSVVVSFQTIYFKVISTFSLSCLMWNFTLCKIDCLSFLQVPEPLLSCHCNYSSISAVWQIILTDLYQNRMCLIHGSQPAHLRQSFSSSMGKNLHMKVTDANTLSAFFFPWSEALHSFLKGSHTQQSFPP